MRIAVFAMQKIGVVPAKAGTHNHRACGSHSRPLQRLIPIEYHLGVWVPAFTRTTVNLYRSTPSNTGKLTSAASAISA